MQRVEVHPIHIIDIITHLRLQLAEERLKDTDILSLIIVLEV
jgi:hypothetical protein